MIITNCIDSCDHFLKFNESPEKLAEAGYCKKVNRKYIFDPIKEKNVEGLYPEVQKLYTEEFNEINI